MRQRKPTEVPASLKNIDLGRVLRKTGIYRQQSKNKQMKEAALPLAKKMLTVKKKTTTAEPKRYQSFTNDEAIEYGLKQIHLIEVVEQKLELKIEQFVNKIVRGFVSSLETETKGYFDDTEEEFLTQAQLDFTPLLTDQAVLAGQAAYDLINHDDIYFAYNFRKQIEANVDKFTQSMLSTDREKLIDMLESGISQGQSIGDIRKAIMEDFGDYSKMQAERITRTEVARVSNQAALDAWEQSGVVEGKQWVTFGAVDECADLDGDIVSLSSDFYGGTDEFKDGDPPLHPNCKCVTIPILVGEKGIVVDNTTALRDKIVELEKQIDKRKKAYKELKAQKIDDTAYIKSLEKYLGVDNEQAK